MTGGVRLVRAVARGLGRRHRSGAGRIEDVALARYLGPGRPLTRPRGLVACVRLDTGDAPVTGVGEAVVPAGQAETAWRHLRRIAAGLVGLAWPDRFVATDPLAEIAAWRPVAAVDRGPVRAAKLAVEMALLDLVAKTGGAVWGAPTSPGPWLPVHQLPKVSPGASGDDLTSRLAADLDPAWARKVRSTGTAQLDLAWLAHLAKTDQRPLWLVGAGLDPATAQGFVRDLAGLLASGEITADVLLEEPVARGDRSALTKLRERSGLSALRGRSPLAELQRIADQVLSGPGRPRLSIVAGESVVSVGQVRRLGVGALHLSAAGFGSLLALREAARTAKLVDPATLVLLGGGRGSGITAAALAALAAATDEIDRYAPEMPVVEWPGLLGDEDGRRWFTGVDLVELSTVADEVAVLPAVTGSAAAEQPNRFPDYPLPGVAMALRSALLETEALRAGLRTRRFSRDLFLAEDVASGTTVGFSDSESSTTSVAASVIALRKGATRDLLAGHGLPVAPGAVFAADEMERAYQAGIEIGFPLVVKPAGGSMGTAVTTDITTPDELLRALDDVAASRYADTGVVVERFASGDDYRILATREEALSVVRREPASVIGDGHHTIEELVLVANVARRQNPHLAKRLIKLDSRVDEQLRRQALTRQSVPEAGLRVRLRAEANFSQGGESHEVLDSTHPSVLRLAVDAVAAIPGLPYAGLDILLADHRRPVDEQTVTIIEVNSRPVQTIHHFPMYGPPRNVSERLVRDTALSAGCTLRAGSDQLTIRMRVTGRVHNVGYQRWLVRMADQFGVTGWVSRSSGPDHLEAVLQGPALRVGVMLLLAFHGPAGAGVVGTRADPADPVSVRGFAVRDDAGGGRVSQ